MKPLKVFLALPSYTGRRYNTSAIVAAHECPGPFSSVRVADFGGNASLLAYAFNRLWAKALTARRKEGFTHFCMLHDDVKPLERTWLRDLAGIMERTGAQALSVVLPMKEHWKAPVPDIVSTALDTTQEGDDWPGCAHFSLRQLEEDFPKTFTVPNLLINTGLLLIDLRESWVEDVYFQTRECMNVNDKGEFSPLSIGEDYELSRELTARGVPVWVTRLIPAVHYGVTCWANSSRWQPSTERGRAIAECDERVQAIYRAAKAAALSG